MTEVVMLFAEIETTDGHEGLGFSYSNVRVAPDSLPTPGKLLLDLIGEDPNDIARTLG